MAVDPPPQRLLHSGPFLLFSERVAKAPESRGYWVEEGTSGQAASAQLKISERLSAGGLTHRPALPMATPMHAVMTTGQHCRGPIETPFRVSSPVLASWCTNSASLRCNCCCIFEKVGGALELLALLVVRAGPSSRLPAGSPVCWDHHRQCSEWVHMPVREILAAPGTPIPTRCP